MFPSPRAPRSCRLLPPLFCGFRRPGLLCPLRCLPPLPSLFPLRPAATAPATTAPPRCRTPPARCHCPTRCRRSPPGAP
eukprot:5805454-Prymnesium_polylepis.1